MGEAWAEFKSAKETAEAMGTERKTAHFHEPGLRQDPKSFDQAERVLENYKYRNLRDNLGFTRACGKRVKQMLQSAYSDAAQKCDVTGRRVNWDFDRFILCDANFHAMNGGRFVEESSILIEQATEQLQKAKAELESTVNDIKAIRELLDPELNRLIDELRAKRQTVGREAVEILNGLKEVRKFFIDREYAEEKTKLAEFAGLMERLQALHRSGFLNSMIDAILKLAEGDHVG